MKKPTTLDLTMNDTTAQRIATLLTKRQQRVVLAESCTGGMAAALLTQVPGSSNWFCGSAVTYRVVTKQEWLGVPIQTIETFSAESHQTTESLAIGVLKKTPEADFACAVTGHLGPDAAPDVDGLVFVSIFARNASGWKMKKATDYQSVASNCFLLESVDRISRQLEAAQFLLSQFEKALKIQATTT